MGTFLLHSSVKRFKNIFAHGWESYKTVMRRAHLKKDKLSPVTQDRNLQLVCESDKKIIRIDHDNQ